MRLDGSSSFKLINEIGILDNFIKFQKTIKLNYHNAPYFERVIAVLDKIMGFDKSNLGRFIYNSLVVIAEYLEIQTELLLSSELPKDNTLKAQCKVIDICKRLGASEYYNAIGGKELYSIDSFRENGLELKFIQTRFQHYAQFENAFVEGLSILDVLMFNDVETINKMLGAYTLV